MSKNVYLVYILVSLSIVLGRNNDIKTINLKFLYLLPLNIFYTKKAANNREWFIIQFAFDHAYLYFYQTFLFHVPN